MNEESRKQREGEAIKRPPFVGLIAFLMGILIGIFIPLSRKIRKK
jgi:hypothetical protein